MKEIKNKIDHTLEGIQEVVDLLYQEKINQGYQKLNMVIVQIANTIEDVFEYKNNNDVDIDEAKFNSALQEALNAMEEKDIVLLADILQYEIMEQFNEIKQKIA